VYPCRRYLPGSESHAGDKGYERFNIHTVCPSSCLCTSSGRSWTLEEPASSPLGVFHLSSLLASEIIWMRLLSYIQWYHFAYMIISIALLGFAASGTFLAWKREKVGSFPLEYYRAFSHAYPASILLSFWCIQRIPFDPFFFIWDARQLLYLSGYCLLLFLPFFIGATCIGIAFVDPDVPVQRLYFMNLLGSGLGVWIVLVIMMAVSLKWTLACVTVLGIGATPLVHQWREGRGGRSRMLIYICIMGMLFLLLVPPIRISEHKPLSKYLLMPGVETLVQRFSPLGQIDVLGAHLFVCSQD